MSVDALWKTITIAKGKSDPGIVEKLLSAVLEAIAMMFLLIGECPWDALAMMCMLKR